MALPLAPEPSKLPMNVLFPEAYRESCRMIVRDFAIFAVVMVSFVCGLVTVAG